MTDCNQQLLFPRCKGRRVEACFSGGDITSNGGVLLLRQVDRVLGLTERVAKALADPRRRASCAHDALLIVRQRVHGQQAGRFHHGYYDHYCFLPLYVFCGDQLLVSYLRPSKIDAARHAWASIWERAQS